MRRTSNILVSILSLMTLPTLLAAKEPTTAPAVNATPADTLSAAAKALHDGDTDKYLDCLTPNAIDKEATSFVGIVAMDTPTTMPTPTDPDKEKAAFEAKYGLDHRQRHAGETDDQLADRLAANIKDKRAFLKEFLSHNVSDKDNPAKSNAAPRLVNLQTQPDGITAVAKLILDGGDGTTMSQDIQFKKIDGSWKIDSNVLF